MNTLLRPQDGIFAEYGKTVNRFPRTIKEGCEGFAQLELSDDEFGEYLDAQERAMKPLIYTILLQAVLVIVSQVWGTT